MVPREVEETWWKRDPRAPSGLLQWQWNPRREEWGRFQGSAVSANGPEGKGGAGIFRGHPIREVVWLGPRLGVRGDVGYGVEGSTGKMAAG